MATTDAPLKRLFERLDFAPKPRADALDAILEHWQSKRGDALFPRTRDFAIADLRAGSAEAFIFSIADREDGYQLAAGSPGLTRLLGPMRGGEGLNAAPNRRSAARLRRLFEVVRNTGGPLIAEFTTDDVEGGESVEILVAPLSSDGRNVTGVLGGVTARATSMSAIHTSVKRALPDDGPLTFAIGASGDFGERVCGHLHIDRAIHEERSFEDGEHKIRPLRNVRNRDVYVIHSLHGDEEQSPNDKLCRLLFLIGALKDAAASRVTAVVPYLCYSRKDRQTKTRDPVTTRYVAQLFEAVGTDRLITMEVHNPAAFQNAFRCDTEHLDANLAFIDYFKPLVGDAPLAVISPDPGGVKRADIFREAMERALQRPIAGGFMEKHRSMGKVTGNIFAGDVAGRTVIVIDDLISTGGTMARVANACRDHGASRVFLAATHGLFSKDAGANLAQSAVEKIVVTDTVARQAPPTAGFDDQLVTLDISSVFAEAIRRCHAGGSINELLGTGDVAQL